MNKEDILKQVGFDLSKAKAIYEWLTQDNQPTTLPPIGVTQPVSIHYDENGDPDGVRVTGCGMDFVLALHNEFDGKNVTYEKAEECSLPDEKIARLYGIHRKEINRLIIEAGGEPLEDLYWTKTPANEVFGVCFGKARLVFYGSTSRLDYSVHICKNRVRVALALNDKD